MKISDSEYFKKNIVSSGKLTKKKVLKITSVAVVVILLLSSLPNLQFISRAPPPRPDEIRSGYGNEDFYYFAGGMVNAANGNLFLEETDISIKGLGFNIEFVRSYNSLPPDAVGSFALGEGWLYNYYFALSEERKTDDATIVEGDFSSHTFTSLGDGNYSAPAGIYYRLNKNDDDSFAVRYLDGTIYNIDDMGELQNITDRNGNKLTFTYYFGAIIKIEDDAGNYLNITWTGASITKVSDSTNREVTYSYSGDGMINVTDTSGNSTLYSYNGNDDLESIIYGDGSRLNFSYEYDSNTETYRVSHIYTSMWNFTSESAYDISKAYEFAYWDYEYDGEESLSDPLNDIHVRMNVTDANDQTSRVYTNKYGSPLKNEDPTGNYTQTKWDADFNIIDFTDKNNKTYNYTYYSYDPGDGSYKTYGQPNKITDPTGNYTESGWEFTDTGTEFVLLLKNVTNKRGYKTHFTYDNNYNRNSTMDARGNTSYSTYDSNGYMINYKDFRGITSNYSYDSSGNLLNITDPGGNITKYGYDSKNRVKNVTDPRGYKTTYEYDDLDRIVKITDALGNSTTYLYDEESEGIYTTGIYSGCGGGYSIGGHTPISIIDANGLQTNLTLNHTIKRIEKIEESPGCGCSEKIFKYDSNGNLIEFEDANGHKTTYAYDAINRLTNETGARGNYTTYTYDNHGNLLSKTNRRGYTTSYEYDELNRKVKETDPIGNYTEYTYDEDRNPRTETNSKGYTTTYYYDELNRLMKIEDALNHNITYTYDENGNRKTETDPNGNTITYTYDGRNRLINVKDALNHETTYDYDSMGNKLNETDANGNKTKYAYDALNRLVSITDANSNVTYYSYNALDRLLNITDANNHKTKQEYDSLGRLEKIIYPSGNQTQYDYDSVGNMVERIDAKNLSTYYEYDELNRLVKITYPDNSTVVYTYDQEGNIVKTTDNAGFGETSEYIYDEMDRVTSRKVDYGAFDKYVNYTYDEVSNRKTMIDPEGNVTYYTYDAMNRMVNITAPGQSPILYQYDNVGRRTRLDYPNGAYTTYSYDNANRINTIWHKKSGGTSLAVYNYTYDNSGNILNFTENDTNYTTYTYDNVYKLTNVSYPDGSWTAYAYDGVGNRLTMKTSSSTTSYTYDEDNRIMTAGSITYKHDENGNLINKTNDGNTTLYEYDYDNMLTKATLPNSSTVIYQYSGFGQRFNKTTSSGTTLFTYDGYNILLDLDENGNKVAIYAYGPNIDEPISIVRNGVSYYYHADHLGSIKLLTDTNENIIATYNYDVFGKILLETGSINNSYRFTGREWDVESGLYYYRARYYDAMLGRFITKDPAGIEEGPKLYPYVGNNPITNVDPTGLAIGYYCTIHAFMAAWDARTSYFSSTTDKWKHAYVGCRLQQAGCSYQETDIIAWAKEGFDALWPGDICEIGDAIATLYGWYWGRKKEMRRVCYNFGWWKYCYTDYRYVDCKKIIDSKETDLQWIARTYNQRCDWY